jgi:hypothetical protein
MGKVILMKYTNKIIVSSLLVLANVSAFCQHIPYGNNLKQAIILCWKLQFSCSVGIRQTIFK